MGRHQYSSPNFLLLCVMDGWVVLSQTLSVNIRNAFQQGGIAVRDFGTTARAVAVAAPVPPSYTRTQTHHTHSTHSTHTCSQTHTHTRTHTHT